MSVGWGRGRNMKKKKAHLFYVNIRGSARRPRVRPHQESRKLMCLVPELFIPGNYLAARSASARVSLG